MKKQVQNPIAKAYISDISGAIENGGVYGLLVQMEYIIANTNTWRGEDAREVKTYIRQWIKEKRIETKDN